MATVPILEAGRPNPGGPDRSLTFPPHDLLPDRPRRHQTACLPRRPPRACAPRPAPRPAPSPLPRPPGVRHALATPRSVRSSPWRRVRVLAAFAARRLPESSRIARGRRGAGVRSRGRPFPAGPRGGAATARSKAGRGRCWATGKLVRAGGRVGRRRFPLEPRPRRRLCMSANVPAGPRVRECPLRDGCTTGSTITQPWPEAGAQPRCFPFLTRLRRAQLRVGRSEPGRGGAPAR